MEQLNLWCCLLFGSTCLKRLNPLFPLPPTVGLIAAPVAMTVFFGTGRGVEYSTTASADDFADGVSSGSKTRSLLQFFQIILIILLPAFICHIHGASLLFSLALGKINVVT